MFAGCTPVSFSRRPRLLDLLHALIDDRRLRQEVSARNLEGMAMHFPAAWRAAVSGHLSRSFASSPWKVRSTPAGDGLLDFVLAGLLGDVGMHVDRPESLGLDRLGRIQLALWRRLPML